MLSVELYKLFDHSRLPEGLALVPLILYFPLGLVLATVRFFIGLHTLLVSCILPRFLPVRSVILRAMCTVLGFIVMVNGQKRDEKAKLIVSNHVTPFDHFICDLVFPNIIPSIFQIHPSLEWLLGWRDFHLKQGRDTFSNHLKEYIGISNIPLLIHPEGTTTNGKFGLLKFSTPWPFAVDLPLQPVTIQVSRLSLFPVSVSTLNSRWWEDLFWILFLPATFFTIKFLPVMESSNLDSKEEFSEQVRKKIAADLKLVTTEFSSADKAELQKRGVSHDEEHQTIQQPECAKSFQDPDQELITMIKQVQEVLPDISVSDIKADLAKSKDVHMTVTNLLEENPKQGFTSTKDSSSLPAPTQKLYAARVFSKVTSFREHSLKERKETMLKRARQQYKDKHNIH